MRVLIKTGVSGSSSYDQAEHIKKELLARNHNVTLDVQASFPAHQFGSIKLGDGNNPTLNLSGKDIDKEVDINFDTVVFFAENGLKLPEEIVDKDKVIIKNEAKTFIKSCDYFLGKDIFWVNPLESFSRSALKPEQLRIAADVGFTIPKTLISNNPVDILNFVSNNKKESIIKPFSNITWERDSKVHSYLPTTSISKKQIEENMESLSYCPMIFQERIEQKYEIRATVFGHAVLAVRMRKKDSFEDTVDWRLAINNKDVVIETYELPSVIKERCIQVNSELGLVYSTFDIAVDELDNYIFYEVNNAGRFIWKEELAGLPMTTIFCDFLESRDPRFKWQ